MKPANPVGMAVIGAAHGVRGEVRVKSLAADPLALGDYEELFDAAGRAFEIVALRRQKEMLVVRFRGVDDRAAAEALTGTTLYVDRSALPDDLGEEEYYHADLVGLAVVDGEGGPVGTVRAVHDFGAGDVLELALAGGGTAMIPFSRAAVPAVDLAARTATVDRLAAGLVDAGDGTGDDGSGAAQHVPPST